MQKPNISKTFTKQFGQFVKKKRLERNWSQAELASKLENNYQNISRMERGEVNPTLLWCFKLAIAFEMDLADLNRNEVEKILESEDYSDEVNQDIYDAQQVGVRGVPFFVLDNKYAVSGAQDSTVFLQALNKTWAETNL